MSNGPLERLSVRVSRALPALYHLSIDSKLEGVWVPREPDPDHTGAEEPLLIETPVAKISVSPTIAQCFQAIYANVKHLYEKDRGTGITFTVYTPVFKGNERILLPETLTKSHAIHDAHITKEHGIIDRVYMRKIGEVTILKPLPQDKLDYYAFDDRSAKEPYGWLPHPVRITNSNIATKKDRRSW